MTLFRSTGSSQGAKDFFEFWKIFSFWKYVLEYDYYFFYINTFTSAPKRTLLFFGVMNFAVVKNLFWDKQLIVGILEVNIFWKKLSVSNTLMRLIFSILFWSWNSPIYDITLTCKQPCLYLYLHLNTNQCLYVKVYSYFKYI